MTLEDHAQAQGLSSIRHRPFAPVRINLMYQANKKVRSLLLTIR
jgi:hypothetical protein